jgi:Uma2 family endonuclease
VSRLYNEQDLRLSYVTWQEGVTPLVAVELLSPGTEAEDLGRTLRDASKPPNIWTVYEQILRIPYYIVFNRYTNELQPFGLMMTRYHPLPIEGQGVWLEDAELGLGLWEGEYQGINRLWLRWYDRDQQWMLTPAEQESQRAERLAAQLRALGVEPEA